MAVTIDDVALELGRATPSADSIEARQWVRWIARARQLIDSRAVSLGVPLDSLDEESVDSVVAMAVAAHVRRPDDSTTVDIQVDDARMSKRYESSTGRVTILPEWWDELGLVDASGAFSVTPYFQPDVLS